MSNVPEEFPVAQYTFPQIQHAYMIEAELLSKVAQSKNFFEILDKMAVYEDYLKSISGSDAMQNIGKITKGTNIIDSSHFSELKMVFYISHMAACCSLLKNSNFFPTQLYKKELIPLIKDMIAPLSKVNSNVLLNISHKFHVMDAVRTMQILRNLGLVTTDSRDIEFLGLGAAGGEKELRSLHLNSVINQVSMVNKPQDRKDDFALSFDTVQGRIKNAVVIDADPQQKEAYKRLNSQSDLNIIAINDFTDKALDDLPELMSKKYIGPRNLISAIRFDHRMFPSVNDILRQLQPNIAEEADLILSVGSGQNIQEFEGRVKKMQEFFDSLEALGMEPVLIKLHGKGDLQKQWETQVLDCMG